MKNIWEPMLAGLFPLGALSGLGVMHSEGIPHAKGAKVAKGANSRKPKLAVSFTLAPLAALA